MAVMKPRTGAGPLEAIRSEHTVTLKIPMAGARLVIEFSHEEAAEIVAVLAEAQ